MNLTKEQFQELDNELNELLAKQDEYVEGSDITKRAVEIQSLIWDYPREPNTYYCKPYKRAADDPWETLTVCPVCGQTSDYCLDHKHWLCELCEEPLEITDTKNGEEIYVCEYCDHCEDCGEPLLYNLPRHIECLCKYSTTPQKDE